MSWSINDAEGGYVVAWGGESWGMEPRSKEECAAYVGRLKERYPEGGAWLVDGAGRTQRRKGGPWRYTLLDGTTEVIHTDRKSDARLVLAARMGRKRLPNGILWSLEV